MRETRNIEFKESVTHTFLKTVSAFCNYGGGTIYFGISDNGTEKGIDNPVKTCLDIENLINANIDPKPDYSLSINESNHVISLSVNEGIHKPYLYKGKAYKRNDSSTIEVDRLELTRLILQGENLSYEELPATDQNLSFDILETKLKEEIHIKELNSDILKTLELYTEDTHFNHAAELIADKNRYHGTDIVRFGKNIDIILDRETIDHCSVLDQFDKTVVMFRKYYQYEKIDGTLRTTAELIPEKAFREAIANALVHRTWDVPSSITVSMYPDRIEVVSPGGLPSGLNEEEYKSGGISILRNPILANIFFRLNIIEKFGTGIRRIIDCYREYGVHPVLSVTENSIHITLPVINKTDSLTPDEKKILSALNQRKMGMSELSKKTGFSKTKTLKLVNELIITGNLSKEGKGRGTKYSS